MSSMRTYLLFSLMLLLALSGAFAGGQQDSSGSEAEGEMGVEINIAEGEQVGSSELEALLGPIPTPSSDYTIGAILKTLINEHWQQMREGYLDAAEELGLEVEVSAASSESALTEQLDLVETMLSRNYSALSVSPLAETNLVPALETAFARGVPVVNVDDARITDIPNVYVGANHRTMAVLAAEYFADYFQGEGTVQVALIEGMAGSSASIQRVEGFTETVAEADNLELVSSLPGNWDRVESLNAMESILQSNPNVRGVYAANDTMALGAMEAIINAGLEDQILVIGTDGVPAAQESIREGLMHGTVAAFPYEMGRIAVEVSLRLLEGQTVPAVVTSPMTLVTAENIDEYFE